jgi:hypothetical protein
MSELVEEYKQEYPDGDFEDCREIGIDLSYELLTFLFGELNCSNHLAVGGLRLSN